MRFTYDMLLFNLAPSCGWEEWAMETGQEGEMRELRGHYTNFDLNSPHFLPCVPTAPLLQSPSSSVLLLGSAVLRNALGSQFSQHIIQVIGIWVAMASEIRAKLCLVVDLIPDDGV